MPAVHSDYEPKGSYKSFGKVAPQIEMNLFHCALIGDFKKVYITGPEKSDNAIIAVYDIFGWVIDKERGSDH